MKRLLIALLVFLFTCPVWAEKQKISDIDAKPFRGGCNTVVEPALIDNGQYSMVQNFRNLHPGMIKRAGQAKLHTTADTSSLVDAAASVFTSGTYAWTAWGTNTLANPATNLTITYVDNSGGAYNLLRNASDLSTDLRVGGAYTISIDAKYAGGAAGPVLQIYSSATATYTTIGTLTTSTVTYTYTFLATSVSSDYVCVRGMGASNVVTLDNFYLYANQVKSIYQSVKPATSTRKTFAQFSDGDVIEFTANPPTVTTGALGSEVYSGNVSPRPGAWSTHGDLAILSTGVDPHQVYAGTGNYSPAVYWYSGSGNADASNAYIVGGKDFTTNLSDGDTTTTADISNFATAGTEVADLITNGTFDTDTTWAKAGTTTIDAGNNNKMVIAAGAGTATQSITPTANILYKVSFTLSAKTDADSDLYVWAADSAYDYMATPKKTTAATHTYYWYSDHATAFDFVIASNCPDAGDTISIDDVKCQQLKNDYIFVAAPVPISSLIFTMSTMNTSAAVAAVKYWNGSAWTAVSSLSDGTIASAGKSFGQSGTMSWTQPSDAVPCTLFGKTHYWIMIYLSSGTVDADTKISGLTYGQSSFTEIANLWDGTDSDLIEARFYDAGAGTYSTYAGSAITMTGLATSDYLYVACTDETNKFNVATSTVATNITTLGIDYWSGSAWTAVTGLNDDTKGFLRQQGSITFAKATSQPTQLFNTGYNAYWYRLYISSDSYNTSAVTNPVTAITYDPYFNSDDMGTGYCNTTWNGRTVYASSYDNYLIISGYGNPQELNGEDAGILTAGDGRLNRVVWMGNLSNHLIAIQEEVGKEGGCITKFTSDDDVDTIAASASVVSNKLGTFSAISADVVDGVEYAELNRDSPVMSVVFALSRSGVYVTDGTGTYIISGDIANYFDPNESECIRKGYENFNWLHYDSSKGVVLIGLVSGSSATTPNVFPVYDVKDKTWSFDSRAQELSCMTEVEADSGSVPVLQIGGGVDDGTVYLLNTGTNDVSTAIDSYVTVEYDANGHEMEAIDLLLRVKSQAAGNVTVTPYANGVARSSITFAQTAAATVEAHRRHRRQINIADDHVSFKIQHNTASQTCTLIDIGAGIHVFLEQ